MPLHLLGPRRDAGPERTNGDATTSTDRRDSKTDGPTIIELRSESDGEKEALKQVKLYHLSSDQRQDFYRSEFAKIAEPLSFLCAPELCDEWPDLTDEILRAYLTYTTFVVKVYLNYDAVNRRFYSHFDPRHCSTGKIIIHPNAAANLQDAGEISRIRFELGTPFNTLALVGIRVVQTDGNDESGGTHLKLVCRPATQEIVNEHPSIMAWVKHICAQTRKHWDQDRTGFDFDYLEDLASQFIRPYGEADYVEYMRDPSYSEWIDVCSNHRWEYNEGHVDKKWMGW